MTIFKAYDIRGIFEQDFGKEEAFLIGYYIVKLLNLKKFKVAHDGRLSFPILTKYFILGLLKAGSKVVYLGEMSTVNFYYSLFSGINSGCMITASHNPKDYNGFKFMINGESFDSRNGLYDLKDVVLDDKDNVRHLLRMNNNFNLDSINLNNFLKRNNLKVSNKFVLNYVNFLEKEFNKIISEEEFDLLLKLNIAIDFSSGVSSIANKLLYKKLCVNFLYFNDEVDGNFSNHSPDPLKAREFILNLKEKFEFIGVFDGDGDRIIFYDENKKLMLTDYLIAQFINWFSINFKEKNYVVDLRISKVIEELKKKYNLSVTYSKVGRAFYKSIMKENNCFFGAELSGHLFFKDFNNLDNPDIAFIYMLKIFLNKYLYNGKKTIKFSNLFKEYKPYFKLDEINLKVKNSSKIFNILENKFKKNLVSKLDGLSFDFKDWWFNIRFSNTEPVIRLNIEGVNKEIVNNGYKILKGLILNN